MHDKIRVYFLPVGRQKLLDIVNKVEHEGKTLIKTMVESKENKIGEGKITSNWSHDCLHLQYKRRENLEGRSYKQANHITHNLRGAHQL